MGLWIARDKDGSLFAYQQKPIRDAEEGCFDPVYNGWEPKYDDQLDIMDTFYPEVTWENSPLELILKLWR